MLFFFMDDINFYHLMEFSSKFQRYNSVCFLLLLHIFSGRSGWKRVIFIFYQTKSQSRTCLLAWNIAFFFRKKEQIKENRIELGFYFYQSRDIDCMCAREGESHKAIKSLGVRVCTLHSSCIATKNEITLFLTPSFCPPTTAIY